MGVWARGGRVGGWVVLNLREWSAKDGGGKMLVTSVKLVEVKLGCGNEIDWEAPL